MRVLFIIEIPLWIVLYLASKNRFNDELALLDIRANRLKSLIPMGLLLLKAVKYRYGSGYEKRLEVKLRNLKGNGNIHIYLKLHIAEKLVLTLLALMFATFVGTQIELDATFALFGFGILAGAFYIPDRQLDDKVKERVRTLQLEFPDFLDKLILLVNAGMNIQGAIRRIAAADTRGNVFYRELAHTINEINSGKPEIQAYEDFARRCRLQEVTLFVSVLIQNLRKGNDRLIPVLRLQAGTCWENRKNIAKKLGEEASTKLLLPIIIIFIAILLMLMTPAVLQLNI